MKYVQINSVPYGSTGRVMFQQHAERQAAGDESWVMWGRGRAARDDHELNFGRKQEFYADVARTRMDGRAGFHSTAATRRLIVKLDEIDPDVVHLHNLHGYYLNVRMLFEWLAARNQRTFWTLHDCWAFTGHCAYFTFAGCDAWRDGCDKAESCPQLGEYPKTRNATAFKRNYAEKRELFTLLPADRLTLITPSEWLANLTRGSFLGKYPVEVRRNTVDTTVFKPIESDFRARHGLEGRIVVLGVAQQWTPRKGLADMLELAGLLDGCFAVVVVGLTDKQRADLAKVAGGSTGARVVGLGPMADVQELVEAYSAADVLFNPTKEDNYPTVNLEAQACGTYVLTYDAGGSAETLVHGCGEVVASPQEAAAVLRAFLAH